MLFDASKTAGLVALLSGAAQAQYALDSFFDVNNFFDEFSFYADEDPTHGFVDYVDSTTAFDMGLAKTDDNIVTLAADATEANPTNGRKSTRVTSNKSWTHGLILGDFNHMPGAACGVWPAFWTFGPNWPTSGEIDILEGVNDQGSNEITLHTGPGCTITNEGTVPTTELTGDDCGAGNGNTGCGQQTSNEQNYGDGFNGVDGGIYAMEWNSDYIAVWFFPRDSIPQDIIDQKPDPSTWGDAAAKFVGGEGCNMDDFFKEHNIIIDTTFCGDWAGSDDVWNNNPTCSAKAATCTDFVGNNPQEFEEAYWAINNIAVYTQGGGNATAAVHHPSTRMYRV